MASESIDSPPAGVTRRRGRNLAPMSAGSDTSTSVPSAANAEEIAPLFETTVDVEDRLKLYAKLYYCDDSWTSPNRLKPPPWLPAKRALLNACLVDALHKGSASKSDNQLQLHGFRWLNNIVERCSLSSSEKPRVERVLFRIMADGPEQQQRVVWFHFQHFAREGCHLASADVDTSLASEISLSELVQSAVRAGLVLPELFDRFDDDGGSTAAAVTSVLHWLAQRYPRLLLVGSTPVIPTAAASDERGIRLEAGLWEAIGIALGASSAGTFNQEAAWSGLGRLLDALTDRQRLFVLRCTTSAVTSHAVDSAGAAFSAGMAVAVGRLTQAMGALLALLLPPPPSKLLPGAPELHGSSKPQSPEVPLQGLLGPLLRLIRAVLDTGALAATLHSRDGRSGGGGGAAARWGAGWGAAHAHADALLHSPAAGAWHCLLGRIFTDGNVGAPGGDAVGLMAAGDSGSLSDSGYLSDSGLSVIAHFALYGATSPSEQNSTFVWPDSLRRGLVPPLAEALCEAARREAALPAVVEAPVPKNSAATADVSSRQVLVSSALKVWPVARDSVNPAVLDLAIRASLPRASKKRARASLSVSTVTTDASSSAAASPQIALTAAALLAVSCFVPSAPPPSAEGQGSPVSGSKADQWGYFDPSAVLDSSVARKASVVGGAGGGVFEVGHVLDLMRTADRKSAKRRRSAVLEPSRPDPEAAGGAAAPEVHGAAAAQPLSPVVAHAAVLPAHQSDERLATGSRVALPSSGEEDSPKPRGQTSGTEADLESLRDALNVQRTSVARAEAALTEARNEAESFMASWEARVRQLSGEVAVARKELLYLDERLAVLGAGSGLF